MGRPLISYTLEAFERYMANVQLCSSFFLALQVPIPVININFLQILSVISYILVEFYLFSVCHGSKKLLCLLVRTI